MLTTKRYSGVSSYLSQLYSNLAKGNRVVRILDIGVGAGHALLPSLQKLFSQHKVEVDLTLIEPSASMLNETLAGLKLLTETESIKYEVFEGTIQSFLCSQDASRKEQHWDICQSSFCLHYLQKEERIEALKWISSHATHFVLFEFDSFVLPFASLEAAKSLKEKYERGTE